MVRQLHPNARDAAQRRINRITMGVIATSVAATLGVGAGIAAAAPPPKHNNKTDYGQKTKSKPATVPTKANQPAPQGNQPAPQPNQPAPQTKAQAPKTNQPPPPAADKPESSSGDEQTTSGGS
ncbi:MAG: hypothetical protein ACJ72N_20900 [Labedaea sp.]